MSIFLSFRLSDSEEESATSQDESSRNSKKQKVADKSTADGTFKKPSGKPARTRTRDQIRTASPSDSDKSPVPKRRKAANDVKEKESSNAKRTTRGKVGDRVDEGHTKTRTNTVAQEQKSAVSVKRNLKGINKDETEKRSSPKRHINPTEKGATLKTFQNITAASPTLTPPAKRMKKASRTAVSTSEAEIDISTLAQPSETSKADTPSKASPIGPSTRRSVSLAGRNSVDSPPVSAASLRQNKNRKNPPSLGNASEEQNHSEMVSPTAQVSHFKQGTKKAQRKSVSHLSPSSGPDLDSDSSPIIQHNRHVPKGTKTVPASLKSRSQNAGSKACPDVSPAVSTRSGRVRRVEVSPSSTPTASQSENTATDSDSSPLPASLKQRRGGDKAVVSSPKMVVVLKKLTSSRGSQNVPQVKGIVPLKHTRRSVSQSDASDSQSDQFSPNIRSTRRSNVHSDDENHSPMSAAELKQKLMKKNKGPAHINNTPDEQSPNSDQSPARRSLRGQVGKISDVKLPVGKKRVVQELKSPSSDSPTSNSTPPSHPSRGGRNCKAVPSEQQGKKTRNKTSSIESPLTDSSRRSLRSQVETPSPRTRSGKI